MDRGEARPKSILKTPTPSLHAASSAFTAAPSLPSQQPPSSNLQQQNQTQPQRHSKASPDPRHLAIALHHAHRIQAQKDAEALILDRILELVTLPSSPSADPTSPSTADVAALKAALVPFQPSDYDNLILERNIEGRCGYALCPRERRREDHKANFRILWGPKSSGRGREMKIVPKEKLEMWCSDDCAERAMYVRVQLTEEPVWERRADNTRTKEVTLLDETRSLQKTSKTARKIDGQVVKGGDSTSSSECAGDQSASVTAIKGLPIRCAAMSSRDLALERGDSNSIFRAGRVDVQVIERETSHDAVVAPVAAPPMLGPECRHGGSIEGYTPRGQSSPRSDGDGRNDEIERLFA